MRIKALANSSIVCDEQLAITVIGWRSAVTAETRITSTVEQVYGFEKNRRGADPKPLYFNETYRSVKIPLCSAGLVTAADPAAMARCKWGARAAAGEGDAALWEGAAGW
jgi:hypothetical protein